MAEERENKEQTEWHRVVFFNRLAEIAGEYLKKGSKVYVEGELRTRNWEKDGQKHYTTEIVANEMQMLDAIEAPSGDSIRTEQKDVEDKASSFDFEDDDIPF